MERGRTMRRLTSAVVAMVLAVPIVTTSITGTPAHAALTNVFPANDSGDIYPDDLTTTDSLFTYVTSDLRGGECA